MFNLFDAGRSQKSTLLLAEKKRCSIMYIHVIGSEMRYRRQCNQVFKRIIYACFSRNGYRFSAKHPPSRSRSAWERRSHSVRGGCRTHFDTESCSAHPICLPAPVTSLYPHVIWHGIFNNEIWLECNHYQRLLKVLYASFATASITTWYNSGSSQSFW